METRRVGKSSVLLSQEPAGSCRVLLFLFALSGLLTSFAHAQDRTLHLIVETDPTRKHFIGRIEQNRLVYASLEDIARAISIRTSEKGNALSLATRLGPVLFTADNPFVVTTNRMGNKAPLQLPVSVIAVNKRLYVPLAGVAPLFEQIFGVKASFESSSGVAQSEKPGPPKPSFDITALSIDSKANGVLLRVSVARPLALYEGLLKDDGWMYLTLPQAKADIATLNKTKPSGAVKKIVATQFPSSVQIAIKLDGKFDSSEIVKDAASNDLLVTIRSLSEQAIAAIEEKKRTNVNLQEQRKRYELDVIVLDAGHGGKDPGTTGVTGTKEKDVALAIVLKLGKLIEQNLEGVKVVFTRKNDTFVELDRRGQMANEEGGKLFISVHCNAMPRKPHPRRGFEVYLLRPGRTDEAISIAERENSVIELEEGYEKRYKKLTDENFILVTMAQSAHMRASEKFAELTTKELNKKLDVPDNGVKQAGFLVLVGSAMPNVLIETAYLSNREDERLLKSAAGQEKYAEAIFNAIKRYKTEYEKLLQEGKDFGEK